MSQLTPIDSEGSNSCPELGQRKDSEDCRQYANALTVPSGKMFNQGVNIPSGIDRIKLRHIEDIVHEKTDILFKLQQQFIEQVCNYRAEIDSKLSDIHGVDHHATNSSSTSTNMTSNSTPKLFKFEENRIAEVFNNFIDLNNQKVLNIKNESIPTGQKSPVSSNQSINEKVKTQYEYIYQLRDKYLKLREEKDVLLDENTKYKTTTQEYKNLMEELKLEKESLDATNKQLKVENQNRVERNELASLIAQNQALTLQLNEQHGREERHLKTLERLKIKNARLKKLYLECGYRNKGSAYDDLVYNEAQMRCKKIEDKILALIHVRRSNTTTFNCKNNASASISALPVWNVKYAEPVDNINWDILLKHQSNNDRSIDLKESAYASLIKSIENTIDEDSSNCINNRSKRQKVRLTVRNSFLRDLNLKRCTLLGVNQLPELNPNKTSHISMHTIKSIKSKLHRYKRNCSSKTKAKQSSDKSDVLPHLL